MEEETSRKAQRIGLQKEEGFPVFTSIAKRQAPGRTRRLTIIAAAGALLLAAGLFASVQAPEASAQGYYPYGNYNYGYNGLYNGLYGYNGYNSLYGYNNGLYGYNGLNGYNNGLYGYNGYNNLYGYNSYPYSSYTYPYSNYRYNTSGLYSSTYCGYKNSYNYTP
jgi:hypothetical protein